MIIASIDIGTNTVLLLISRVEKKTSHTSPILNEYRMPRLGKGLAPGGNIKKDRILHLFMILDEYKEIISEHKVEETLVTATNAFRIAKNATYIVNEIKNKFNWKVNIISGRTEAEFAYLGAVSNLKTGSSNLVIDIGGGSTELIIGSGKNIEYRKSFQTGSVSSTERFLIMSPPSIRQIEQLNLFINDTFEELKILNAPDFAIAISGTPTTIACMIRSIMDYDNDEVDGSYLMLQDLNSLIEILMTLTKDAIRKKFGSVVNGREDIILGGALILFNIMKLLKLSKVMVSSRGIRYGAIISYLNRIEI